MSSSFHNLKCFFSNSKDPYLNLSIENFLFRNLKPEEHILFFYKNNPCVVMGRFQNPWQECLVEKAKRENVLLVRRQSGGGAVYHDLNNLNFCFMDSTLKIDKKNHNKMIIDGLKQLNIDAFSSERFDLLLRHKDKEYKFSGSAFKQSRGHSFHHGTLLIKTDLLKLNQYLNPIKKDIKTKATSSVRRSVINLTDINQNINEQLVLGEILKSFNGFHKSSIEMETLDIKAYKKFDEIRLYYDHLMSPKWIFNETPKFEVMVKLSFGDYGDFNLKILVKKGIIYSIEFDSAFIHYDIEADIQKLLKNQLFQRTSFKKAYDELSFKFSIYSKEINLLFDQIEDQLFLD